MSTGKFVKKKKKCQHRQSQAFGLNFTSRNLINHLTFLILNSSFSLLRKAMSHFGIPPTCEISSVIRVTFPKQTKRFDLHPFFPLMSSIFSFSRDEEEKKTECKFFSRWDILCFVIVGVSLEFPTRVYFQEEPGYTGSVSGDRCENGASEAVVEYA